MRPFHFAALLPLALSLPALAEEGATPEAVLGAATGEASGASEDEDGWRFRGSFLEEYRGRATSAPSAEPGEDPSLALPDESDHDLRLFVDMSLTSPDDAFRMNAVAGLWIDADGYPDTTTSGLASAFDYGKPVSPLWGDVFVLSAEYRTEEWLQLARGGRQVAEYGRPTTFDGATFVFEAAPRMLDVFVYGGRTVHFFETDLETFQDWIAACGFEIRPMAELKLELQYRFMAEEITEVTQAIEAPGLPRADKQSLIDHTYDLTMWYRRDDWLGLKVGLGGIDDTFARAALGLALTEVEWDMGLDLTLDAQTTTLRSLVDDVNPTFQVLGESLPNLKWRLDLWKVWATRVGDYGLHLGWNARELLEGEEGPFNRNVGRIYLAADARDIGVEGPFFGVSMEAHYTRADAFSDDLILAIGGSAGWDDRVVRAEVGTFYQRFKYDYFQEQNEVSDVRTWFVAVGYKPLDWLGVRARYEYEQVDRDYHTFTLALSQQY